MRSASPTSSGSSVDRKTTTRPASASSRIEMVDLALGTDVDAARRIVQQHDIRMDLQPLPDDDLLLVATRELMDRRSDGAHPIRRLSICRRAAASISLRRSHGSRVDSAPTLTWTMLRARLRCSIRP